MFVVVITDVEVGFEELEYEVVEGGGRVHVCANMTGRLDTAVTILFSTEAGTGAAQSGHGESF